MFDLYLQLPQIEKQFINTFKILYKTQAFTPLLALILSACGVWYAAQKIY